MALFFHPQPSTRNTEMSQKSSKVSINANAASSLARPLEAARREAARKWLCFFSLAILSAIAAAEMRRSPAISVPRSGQTPSPGARMLTPPRRNGFVFSPPPANTLTTEVAAATIPRSSPPIGRSLNLTPKISRPRSAQTPFPGAPMLTPRPPNGFVFSAPPVYALTPQAPQPTPAAWIGWK